MDNANSAYTTVDGALYTKDLSMILRYPEGKRDVSFSLPESVTNIGEGAFYNCRNLKELTIPNSVTGNVEGDFISGCSSLQNIYVYKTNGILTNSINTDGITNCVMYVPSGLFEEYKTNQNYSNFDIRSKNLIINDCSVNENPTPTCVSLKMKLSEKYCHITESGIIDHNIKNTGDNIIVMSLEPEKNNDILFYTVADDGYKETKTITITTPKIDLTTQQPQIMTNNSVLVIATTNISDEESNAGFQWIERDAPETIVPNEIYATVHDGYLKYNIDINGLQTSSYYKVRAFYKSAAGNYYYGDWQIFKCETDGIVNVPNKTVPVVEGYYNCNGHKSNVLQRGVNIIRYTDGTTYKMFVK